MTNKIDTNKKYQTREGNEAHIFYITTDDVLYQVSGQIKKGDTWINTEWNIYGSNIDGDEHPYDLIEVVEENTSDFDPTQNRVPSCLLTKGEKEILRNWPHGLELYDCFKCCWHDVIDPTFSGTLIYRAKPAPERIVTWANVYDGWIGPLHKSRKKADDSALVNRLCVYRIERDADGGNPEISVEDV